MYNILLVLSLFPVISLCQSKPMICLGPTCFTGSWITTDKGLKYASFQGIKYAQAPIGNLRFKPPQAHQYNELVDVSGESKVQCPQQNFITQQIVGDEDCLLLNIYVPDIAIPDTMMNNIRLPVMVWIHGGGYTIGSGKIGDYNPTNFMDTQSVVIVTMNYRLGPLGFLSLGIEDVPGNAGLRDQSMALGWVKENIARFGGDDEKITIFGESAGGSSVASHLLSPLTKGLFHRAILQSPWTAGWYSLNAGYKAVNYAKELSQAIGCNSEVTNEILSCLQEKTATEILTTMNNKSKIVKPWTPVLDYDFTSNPYFKSKNIDHCLESGHFNTDVEIMIGTTADEGILSIFEYAGGIKKWEDLRNNIGIEGAKGFFNIGNPEEITSDIKEKINQVVKHYIGSTDNIDGAPQHMQGIIDMFTDPNFLHSAYKLNNYLVKQEIPVYQYIFTYQGQHSLATAWFGFPEPIGVCHGDELFYLWNFPNWNVTLNEADKAVMKTMTQNWINFAKTGTPDPNWTPIGPEKDDQFNFWNISSPTPEMTFSPDIKERMEFWDQISMNNHSGSNRKFPVALPWLLVESVVWMFALS